MSAVLPTMEKKRGETGGKWKRMGKMGKMEKMGKMGKTRKKHQIRCFIFLHSSHGWFC